MSRISLAAQLACKDIYQPVAGKNFSKLYKAGDTVCGIRFFNKLLYICNQGTANIDGVKADLDCSMYEHPILGGMHAGFQDNLPELIRNLLPDIPTEAQIICTGHSKGAAEAAQLAGELYLLGFNIKQCILFGCPKAGDKKFASWMQKNILGVSYRNAVMGGLFGDPIPLLPGRPFEDTYTHTDFIQYPYGWRKILPTQWHRAQLYYDHFCLHTD